jgi:hypothetical protein
MHFGFEGFADGMNAVVAAHIDHATENQHNGHDAGHLDPPDVEHFHVFSPWDAHGNLTDPGLQDRTAVVGNPAGDGFTHQTTAFTCAVVSQKMILDQFHVVDPRTGEPVSEAQLVYDATVHGWLDDHGTALADMGRLLEHYGISCHHDHGWSHLVNDLAHGHQVMIAVDAQPLWTDHDHSLSLGHLFAAHPNHALVLKGMRVNEQGHVVVTVNDPGQPAGAGVEYPLEQFQEALGTGSFNYVATDNAPFDWMADPAVPDISAAIVGDNQVINASYDTDSNGVATFLANLNDQQRHEFLRSL